MSEMLEVRFTCKPGEATAEFALECQEKVLALMQSIADDIAPGVLTYKPQRVEWVDDGIDEIVIRVSTEVIA